MNIKFYMKGPTRGGDWVVERFSFGSGKVNGLIVSHWEGKILGFLACIEELPGEGDAVSLLSNCVEKWGPPRGVYSKLGISDFCAEKGITLLEAGPLESPKIVEGIEQNLIWAILHQTTSQYKKWRGSWPAHLKGIPTKKKAKNKEFKKLLYSSEFFEQRVAVPSLLKKGMEKWNEQWEVSITPHRIKSQEEEKAITNKFARLYEEVSPAQRPLLKGIEVSFVALARLELVHLGEIKDLKAQVGELLRYKENSEAEKAAKELRRQNRLKRVRRPKCQPFRKEYMPWVLNYIENTNSSILTKTRLRVAIALLVITGLRVSEIRNIKVGQVVTLLGKNYMSVNLSKRGRKGHKVYLSTEGQSLLSNYRGDISNLLFLTGMVEEIPNRRNWWEKVPRLSNLYIFSATQGQNPLSRYYFTREINKILKETPELSERGAALTSHSFRHGYITALWRNSNDLEFVRQVIGHATIGTTSLYVQELPDEERKMKLANLKF